MLRPKIIHLPKISDPRGNLSFFENLEQIPFVIARTYWIYDVPGGEKRGGHAYQNLNEFIIALSGSFDVVCHSGDEEIRFTLNRSYYGVYMPPMYWRSLENFSTNALALIVADLPYKQAIYLRDLEEFKRLKNG